MEGNEGKIWLIVVTRPDGNRLFKNWVLSRGRELELTMNRKEACAFHSEREAQTCANLLASLDVMASVTEALDKEQVYGA